MATGPITQITDVVVPEIFTPYIQQQTEQKSRLIASGAIARDGSIDAHLAGAGLTFNTPSFKDLDDDADNVSTDAASDSITGGSADSAPMKIGTATEIAVRLSRNQSWSSADLAAALIGNDPMQAIGARVSDYWVRRLQTIFVATMTGVFADNAAAPTGTEHTQDDLTHDISATYSAGTTDFSANAFLDATLTMGDSDQDLGMVFVHSIVFNRMQKNNLIDFIPDARGEVLIPTFLGRQVIRDDAMPNAAGTFETWIFGAGAVRLGMSSPKVPTAVTRHEASGGGGGSEILFNRHEFCLHPAGHAYVGTSPNGGPTNAATTNNLAAAASWQRVFSERKQIKIARLITQEY
ncbi:MAG: hypothetical protein GY941_19855 [Planctomycetes bacterium]|nr:hypothetical protein [Planctomycetota bacterium]